MLTAVIMSSVLMIEGQSSSAKQDLQLTPEGVAASIESLARSYSHSVDGLSTKDPAFRKELSKELIRLNQSSEETIRKVADLLLRLSDDLFFERLIINRLLFLLRYRPPTPPGGFTRQDFTNYHHNIITPHNVDGLEEYKDYPSLNPRDYYDWPWKLTKDGWQIRWFTLRGHPGPQRYKGMYEVVSKFPLRKGVNVKKSPVMRSDFLSGICRNGDGSHMLFGCLCRTVGREVLPARGWVR